MVQASPPRAVAYARRLQPGQSAWSTGLCGASVGARPRNRVLPLARHHRPCPLASSRNHRTNTWIKAPTPYGVSDIDVAQAMSATACRFPFMSEDFSIAWSWLSPDQQSALRQNPRGPVPPALVPRLKQIRLLGIGSRERTSPTGEVQWFLPSAVAEFISTQD